MKCTPNLVTIKGDKTFKFYFFTIAEYESGLDFSVESEVLLFQDECIEMDGHISDITEIFLKAIALSDLSLIKWRACPSRIIS